MLLDAQTEEHTHRTSSVAFVFERRTGPGLGTFGQEGELIYVTSQGSQLTVEALELALESFAQPCFACHVSAISFGMVKAWIETILHVFETLLLVCRSVGRSVRLRSYRPDLGVSFVDAWSVYKVTQACSLSPEPQRDT